MISDFTDGNELIAQIEVITCSGSHQSRVVWPLGTRCSVFHGIDIVKLLWVVVLHLLEMMVT